MIIEITVTARVIQTPLMMRGSKMYSQMYFFWMF
jgi:hypothetical protein